MAETWTRFELEYIIHRLTREKHERGKFVAYGKMKINGEMCVERKREREKAYADGLFSNTSSSHRLFLAESKLLARVNVDGFDTSLAFYVAAPVEFTFTSLLDRRLVRVVASTATHQIAAVHSCRSSIARPSVSAY